MLNQLPDHVAAKIREKIAKDLSPSAIVVHFKLLLSVAVGGLISLTICGQFGMGMTSWAEAFSHKIHENMSSLSCAAICGTVYAIFPTLFLRLLLCSPLQFKVILKKRFQALCLWYVSTGILLASYGQHGQGLSEIFFWSLSAILTSYIIASIMRAIFPIWDLQKFART